jgi:hypothetical protein
MASDKNGSRMTVTERDWEHMSTDNRDWLVFSTLKSMDKRLEVIETKSRFDKCWSFLGGVVGGVAAALGIKVGT